MKAIWSTTSPENLKGIDEDIFLEALLLTSLNELAKQIQEKVDNDILKHLAFCNIDCSSCMEEWKERKNEKTNR